MKKIMHRIISLVLAFVLLLGLMPATEWTIFAEEAETDLNMYYDDHLDMTGKTVEIVDAGTPTSYQVGYGIAEGTLDTAVVTLEGNTLVAIGTGTATVKIDGQLREVTVTAAPISLLFLGGQSNMQGVEGSAKQSIICPEGQVYSTYGAYNVMVASNATTFAPSALTGSGSAVNVEGNTTNLEGYPVHQLTEAGDGKPGADSGYAYEWVKQTGEKVWVINAAHGGKSISTWQKGKDNYNEAVALFSACQQTLSKEIAAGHFTFSHMGFFWCQGCTDELQTAKWYADKYLAMHEALKEALTMDIDGDGIEETIEFSNITMVMAGHVKKTGYRYEEGVYDSTDDTFFMTYEELEMRGPRVAQYWLAANPDYPEINLVCNLAESWVTMPDGSDSVAEYFASHYENGKVDYTTQVTQSASWYTPTTVKQVKDTIHYNQIGYNEIGRESARNTLILLGEIQDTNEKTTVTFLDWTGYREVTSIEAATSGQSGTLVVPHVYPCYRSKQVSYQVGAGLHYEYFDLTAEHVGITGMLTASGANTGTVSVVPGKLNTYRWEMNEEGTALVNITTNGYAPNALTLKAGTVEDGVLTGVRYAMAKTATLLADKEWIIEWKASGNWSGMLFSTNASTGIGDQYFFRSETTNLVALGYRHQNNDGSASFYNYGTKSHGIDWSKSQTFRLKNKITVDESGNYVSNMVYLEVDGKTICAMNDFHILTASQNATVDWINGQNLLFNFIGNTGEQLISGMDLEYLMVIEEHIHSYGDWSCNEQTKRVERNCTCGETETAVSSTTNIDGTVTGYVSAEAALNGAVAGDTVKLWTDMSVDYLELSKGITLDLNGQIVTATYAVVDNGNHIIDSAGSGLLKVPQGQFIITSTSSSSYLPIWNNADGYVFTACSRTQTLIKNPASNTATFYFLPWMNESVHDYLEAGSSTSGVTLHVKISYTLNGETMNPITCNFGDELVERFYAGYENGEYAYAFKLTLTGTDAVENLTFEAFFKSCGVMHVCGTQTA